MTDEPTASDNVLEDLRSVEWPIWHEAVLDITDYLKDLTETLWSELQHYENHDHQRHAALCWALTHLDCRGHFLEVFRIAVTGCFEAQSHALHILHHQFAEITEEELAAAEALLASVDQLATCNTESREVLRSELREILNRRQ